MRGATIKSNPERTRILPILIDDSITVVIGDMVTVNTDGHVALASNSDEKLAGTVTGFVDADGVSPAFATGFRDRVTTDSDNTTVALVRALVDVGREIWFQMDADASLSQTHVFMYFDLNNSYQVDVGDASDTDGAVQLLKLDPEGSGDASMGLYRIADHQLGHVDS